LDHTIGTTSHPLYHVRNFALRWSSTAEDPHVQYTAPVSVKETPFLPTHEDTTEITMVSRPSEFRLALHRE